MNQAQLRFVNDKVKEFLSNNGDLKDFTEMMDQVLKKPKVILNKQLPFIDYKELCRDIISLKIAINRIAGWSDTIDITTNPEEYDYLMRIGDLDDIPQKESTK